MTISPEVRHWIENREAILEASIDQRYEARFHVLEQRVQEMSGRLAELEDEMLALGKFQDKGLSDPQVLENVARALEQILTGYSDMRTKLMQMKCFLEQHKHPDGKSVNEQMMEALHGEQEGQAKTQEENGPPGKG